MAKARRALTEGTEIGGYRIVRQLGEGAMGTVYEAVDGDSRHVAFKLLHAHLDADPAARERMAREVAALQRLSSHNIAAVLDAELDGAEAFIVTELIDGVTLAQEVAAGGPLDPIDLFELADQLGAALEAVHLAGVVHRDIKPANVMVAASGPVLIDFGIAQGIDAAHEPDVVGTPGYLAPELLSGKSASAESDWWSWAAVLAFAATGRPPFGSGPTDAVLARSREGRADLVGLPARTARAIAGALQAPIAARISRLEVTRAIRRDADDHARDLDLSAPIPVVSAEPALEPVAPIPTEPAPRRSGHPRAQPAPDSVRPPTATQVFEPVSAPLAGQLGGAPILGRGAAGYAPATAVFPSGMAQPESGPELGATAVFPMTPAMTAVLYPVSTASAVSEPAPMSVAWPEQRVAPGSNLPGPVRSVPVPPGSNPAAAPVATYFAPLGHQPAALPTLQDPAGYARPSRHLRTGTLLALLLPLLLLAAQHPVAAVATFAVLVVIARVVGVTSNYLQRRRERSGGVRGSDGPVTVARFPLLLVRGVLGALPQLLVGAALGLLLMLAGYWVFGTGRIMLIPRGDEASVAAGGINETIVFCAVLSLAMLAVALATWFGTNSRMTRVGARTLLDTFAPRRVGALTVWAVCLILAALLVGGLLAEPLLINWWPLPAPPPL